MRDHTIRHTVRHDAVALRYHRWARSMSVSARELHVGALAAVRHTTTPRFVPDHVLDRLAPGTVTTLAALELSLAGVWHRTDDGGYSVTPPAPAHAGTLRRLWRVLNSDRLLPF